MLGVVTSKDPYWDDASAGFTAAPAHRKRPVLPHSENDFLAQLGERVRTVRLSRDMPRRQLANRSGISERYISPRSKPARATSRSCCCSGSRTHAVRD
jgi:hypothetical protein